jgi:hypothetical protein
VTPLAGAFAWARGLGRSDIPGLAARLDIHADHSARPAMDAKLLLLIGGDVMALSQQ